jgi:hypothetical protein
MLSLLTSQVPRRLAALAAARGRCRGEKVRCTKFSKLATVFIAARHTVRVGSLSPASHCALQRRAVFRQNEAELLSESENKQNNPVDI